MATIHDPRVERLFREATYWEGEARRWFRLRHSADGRAHRGLCRKAVANARRVDREAARLLMEG